MRVVNPTTGRSVRRFAEHSEAIVGAKLEQALHAFDLWRTSSYSQRSQALIAVADILRKKRSQLALLITEEMGKPISQAEVEIDKCAWVCQFYAENAEQFLAQLNVAVENARSYVRFDPLGPVLAIMPWNFPFWQVFRFAAPALMAGNVALLKHAANVPGLALAIEKIFRDAAVPEGVFGTLLISSDRINDVIAHAAVKAVTLTGSERAGKQVAAEAGKQLKKTVLELGGSDPFVVLADADLPEVARQAVTARTINSGQSCIAAKRFIVVTEAHNQFVELLVERMKLLKVGDPRDPSTDVGPLAREDLRDSLYNQVIKTVEQGATLLCGGKVLPGEGFFYPPTVLTGVRPDMPAFDEETFGPVAAVIEADDAAEAIRLANQSRYGLGASIWTRDVSQAEQLAAEFESGCVFINAIVKSDPRLPFGGIKNSGYGRELSHFGLLEFTNIKTVWIG